MVAECVATTQIGAGSTLAGAAAAIEHVPRAASCPSAADGFASGCRRSAKSRPSFRW